MEGSPRRRACALGCGRTINCTDGRSLCWKCIYKFCCVVCDHEFPFPLNGKWCAGCTATFREWQRAWMGRRRHRLAGADLEERVKLFEARAAAGVPLFPVHVNVAV